MSVISVWPWEEVCTQFVLKARFVARQTSGRMHILLQRLRRLFTSFCHAMNLCFVNGHQREILLPSQRYLLFLAAAPSQVRQKWIESFQLDPKQDYYRGEELSRGVVPLFRQTGVGFTPMQPPVLEKLAQLCGAVRPPRVEEKLAALKLLASSGDPALQKEADAAANALRAKRPPKE